MTTRNINILGWVLFIASAFGFMIAGWGYFWAMFGSVFFHRLPGVPHSVYPQP